jgi:hypothetical protein
MTQNTERVVKQAVEEARTRGDREWNREHVLLALTRLGDEAGASVAEVLDRLGIHERRVREVIDRHRPPGPELEQPPAEPGKPPAQVTFAGDQVERLFLHTRWVAAYLGRRAADTAHLLLGLLCDDRPEDRIFAELALRFEDVYQELIGEPPPEEVTPPRPVIVPIGEFETVLRMLPRVLPSGVSFGFALDDERAWFDTSSDVDLEDYVRRALAQAGNGSNEGDGARA